MTTRLALMIVAAVVDVLLKNLDDWWRESDEKIK